MWECTRHIIRILSIRTAHASISKWYPVKDQWILLLDIFKEENELLNYYSENDWQPEGKYYWKIDQVKEKLQNTVQLG